MSCHSSCPQPFTQAFIHTFPAAPLSLCGSCNQSLPLSLWESSHHFLTTIFRCFQFRFVRICDITTRGGRHIQGVRASELAYQEESSRERERELSSAHVLFERFSSEKEKALLAGLVAVVRQSIFVTHLKQPAATILYVVWHGVENWC